MWKVLPIFLILWTLTAADVSADDPGSREYFRDLSERPDDTTMAENLRIWLAIERAQTCRLSIEIKDSTGTVVRHLLNRLMPKGYYNLYWDRRDDSGNTVPPGNYAFQVIDCGQPWRSGGLTVTYPRGEQLVDFKIPSRTVPDSIWFDITADSMTVNIEIYDGFDMLLDRPVVDSVFERGRHGWSWAPDETETPMETGRYKLYAWFDGYMYATTIWHRR